MHAGFVTIDILSFILRKNKKRLYSLRMVKEGLTTSSHIPLLIKNVTRNMLMIKTRGRGKEKLFLASLMPMG